jgi:hypothetical protein
MRRILACSSSLTNMIKSSNDSAIFLHQYKPAACLLSSTPLDYLCCFSCTIGNRKQKLAPINCDDRVGIIVNARYKARVHETNTIMLKGAFFMCNSDLIFFLTSKNVWVCHAAASQGCDSSLFSVSGSAPAKNFMRDVRCKHQ